MSSLLTNNSAMSALQNLATTQKNLSVTQAQISSGLKVANASDNAAYWSIATSMKSDTSALSAVSDALNLGSSVVTTATAAISSTLTILNKIKADVVTAQQVGTDPAQVQTDIAAQVTSLKNIVGSASFNGVNLLDGSQAATVNVVGSFTRGSSGVSVGTIPIDSTATKLLTVDSSGTVTGGLLQNVASADVSTGGVDLVALQKTIETAIGSVTSAGASLGSVATSISNQSSFVSSLSDAITSGVGSLIDADMNVASTRLQALQTQQQLGVQALSIANQNSQLILKLFNG